MVLKFIHIFVYILPLACGFLLYKMYKCWRTKDQRDCSLLLIMFIMWSLLSIYVFWHFFHDFERISEKRKQKALDGNIPIDIALVWSNADDGFLQGAQLAVDKINKQGGIQVKNQQGDLKARQLSLVPYINPEENDQSSIAFNSEIMAVVGHKDTQQAVKGSLFYDQANILYIAPLNTYSVFSHHDSNTSIQTMVDTQTQITHIIDFALQRGLNNILILKPKDKHVTTFKPIDYDFKKQHKSGEAPITVNTRSYADNTTDFQEFVIASKSLDFDAIYVVGRINQVAHLIKELRTQEVTVPILGLNYFDSQQLFDIAGQWSNDVYISSVYTDQKNIPKRTFFDGNFEQDFFNSTGKKATYISAKAYESIYLLAQVWSKNTIIDTPFNSATLRAQNQWEGLYGELDFSETGQVINHPVFIQKSMNQQFSLEH